MQSVQHAVTLTAGFNDVDGIGALNLYGNIIASTALDLTATRRSRRTCRITPPIETPSAASAIQVVHPLSVMRPMTLSKNVCKRGLVVAAVALVSLQFVLVEGAHTSGGGSAPFPSPTSLAFVVPHSSTA